MATMTITVTSQAIQTASAPGSAAITATIDTPSTSLYGAPNVVAQAIAKIITETMH